MLLRLLTTYVKRTAKSTFSFRMPKVKIKVNQGTIVGCQESLPDGRYFQKFSGIPYAKAPINELRFQDPQKLLKFEQEELDCTKESDPCFHKSPIWKKYVGSEDCLHLNVYVPEHDSSKKLPVMVFIHGGGFAFDSSSRDFYSPEYLLMEDVIIVTLNYRLHVLGFLSLPDAGISGNAGMKDQQMALEWIHENIGNFNGDPERVCLFSESAGAAAGHLHVLSQKSRKYFNSAICQSGNAIADWLLQRNAPENSRRFAKLLGSKGTSDSEHLKTLMGLSLNQLYDNITRIHDPDERRRNLPLVFKPSVELESECAFMTKTPIEQIKCQEGQIQMPIIFGTTSGDGMTMVSDYRKKLQLFDNDMGRVIPLSVNVNPISADAEKLANQIKEFYFDDKGVTEETVPQFVDLMTDFHFLISQTICNELHAIYQPDCKQYLYEFGFDGELNLYKKLLKMNDIPGACHFDDISHLFKAEIGGLEATKGSRDWKMRETMCKLWTNFAKYSDPTPDDKNPLSFKWMPIKNGKELNYLIINDECKMVKNIHKNRLDFWRGVYEQFNGNFLNPK